MSILTWLFLAVIYDGIVLLIVFLFNDYPLEKVMIALSVINPIDLARILLLINIDISALLGYTGAVFENFFGDSTAVIFSITSLFLWVLLPFQLGMRKFQKMDL
jgi:Cu-processing system permease protein